MRAFARNMILMRIDTYFILDKRSETIHIHKSTISSPGVSPGPSGGGGGDDLEASGTATS